jgi:hypothetical protein
MCSGFGQTQKASENAKLRKWAEMTDEEVKEITFRILAWALDHPIWGSLLAMVCVAWFLFASWLFVGHW